MEKIAVVHRGSNNNNNNKILSFVSRCSHLRRLIATFRLRTASLDQAIRSTG